MTTEGEILFKEPHLFRVYLIFLASLLFLGAKDKGEDSFPVKGLIKIK